jgi:alpha-L-fucosidase
MNRERSKAAAKSRQSSWRGNKRAVAAAWFATICALPVVRAAESGHVGMSPSPTDERVTPGPFQPSWESLQSFKTPQWFQDAKFGIWAHWTAQCVPEQGEWYARDMYEFGSHDYQYQCEHYGHPSKVGFKDIDHIWHAEHWDPEKLIALYKSAGAQYFVALANHHDNFDCFDSKYQPWNSVAIGPKRDIVGEWAKAARAAGLKFGVSIHAARTWAWFEVAQGADPSGPLAGVKYDGVMTKADGVGKWWNGLDPQDLYAQNHPIGAKPSQAYCDKFYNRTLDLIHKYHPDLVYFDDSVLPLNGSGQAFGLNIAADVYNTSASLNGGQNQAIMNTKGLNQLQRQCLTLDIERGIDDKIDPNHWQTDTCIGHWHYNLSLFEHHGYKSAPLVVHMLADIVSKNGNLLLSIPVRPDGTLDDDELKFLKDMSAWMDINKEAILGTTPWSKFGEGPSTAPPPTTRATTKKSQFNEGSIKYTAQDIRFTRKGKTLYAILFGWPDSGTEVVTSLGKQSNDGFGTVKSVEMLGSQGPLKFTQDDDALSVTLPAEKPCQGSYVLKITPTE